MNKSKENSRFRFFYVSLLFIISLNILLNNWIIDLSTETSDGIQDDIIEGGLPKGAELSYDNILSGLGAAWNITHKANRTDFGREVSFGNGTYDNIELPFGADWEGKTLNSTIYNLYDTRNWCNGSYEFGPDDGDYSVHDVDNDLTINSFQNWTFYKFDNTSRYDGNNLSGNYYNNLDGHDCLQLYIGGWWNESTGQPWEMATQFGYDKGDRCWWNTSFDIPRGKVVDSWLEFDLRTVNILEQNTWELRFYLNDVLIHKSANYYLKEDTGNSWATIRIPQGRWINETAVFSDPVNTSTIRLNVSYEVMTTEWYQDFAERLYQEIYIDNVKLITKSEVKPEQIGLKLNNTNVSNVGWGKGTVELDSNWQVDSIFCNYSCTDIWNLSNYDIELLTDLNLYAIQNSPDTNYETNFNSIGTRFSADNNSKVNWEAYAYVNVPIGYTETEMRINYPDDINISWVSFPQDPTSNKLNQCDNSTNGLLIIPVNDISTTPNGYWKLKGISPNYCEQLDIYKNTTNSPSGTDWVLNNQFNSGDYINITAKVSNTGIISGHILNTKAHLQVRLPNGTIWTNKAQFKSPDINGYINFDMFQIPYSQPYYEAGEYEAIITWNNSHSSFDANESGIIYRKFNVIHKSTFLPDQGLYFIDNVVDDRIINLKVSYKDKIDNHSIGNAKVYTIFKSKTLNFSEISPGFYFLEFNASEATLGNNTLTIQANSTYYVNQQINMTIYVIKKTQLTVDNQFFSVPWKENFTLQFNYSEKNSGIGINTTPSHDWKGETHILRTGEGQYNLTCNTSAYAVNQLYKLNLNLEKYGYETQNISINVQITEIDTTLQIYLNNTDIKTIEFYNMSIGQQLNITAIYHDKANNPINSATLSMNGTSISKSLLPHSSYNQYNITLSAEEIGIGVKFLTLSASKDNYTTIIDVIKVIVSERTTTLELFINNTQFFENDKYTVQVGEYINISVVYRDLNTSSHLNNASINLVGLSDLNETQLLEIYNLTISTDDLTQGFTILTILASKTNYQSQSIHFIIEVIERHTKSDIFINKINKTLDRSIELPINSKLNITLFYVDNQTGDHISGATVVLKEAGSVIGYLNETNEQYMLVLNTNELEIGVRFISITANKTNYQTFNSILRITVNRIQTKIETKSGKTSFKIRPGESITIDIELLDLDFKEKVENADVEYTWELGGGKLKESGGVFSVTFENVPEGTYTITITVDAGIEYDFERFEIILNVVTPEEEVFFFQIVLIISVTAAIGIGSYLYAYQKVLKYPKTVRKVRNFKKKLKNKKLPKIEVKSREILLDNTYQDLIGDFYTLLGEKQPISKTKDKIKKINPEKDKGDKI